MKDEGLLFENNFADVSKLLQQDFKLLIPNGLRQSLNQHEQTAAASILKNIYFWKKDVHFKFPGKFVEVRHLDLEKRISYQIFFTDNW